MNVRFDQFSFPQIIDKVLKAADSEAFRYVVTPNVDHMLRISANRDIAQLYSGAWLCLNDSRVLERLAATLGVRLPATPGADLVVRLLKDPGLRRDTPILIVGGGAGLVAELTRLCGLTQVTQHRPPMGLLHDAAAFAETLRVVEESDARLVFLAIGSPQQEFLAAALSRGGRARGVGLCVGAALEFLVGERRRAPGWMQNAGLEWAFRLGCEPRRLGRRYLVDGPRIVGAFLAYARARRVGLGQE